MAALVGVVLFEPFDFEEDAFFDVVVDVLADVLDVVFWALRDVFDRV